MTDLKRVAVTGGGGQISYSLLFRIASGEMFGPNTPIALHLLEIPQGMDALNGVVMELQDSSFPLLREMKVGSDPYEVFGDVDVAILVGAKPRGPGMERKDLLADNGRIFVEQGKALNQSAKKSVQVFVVGNPCNTNCLIAMHHAPDIPKTNFCSMTRLDQNRAQFQLSQKAGVDLTDVKDVIIWGNHSATQVPDYFNAKIRGKKAPEVITDQTWLQKEFMETVQKRGAAIIKARGKSSAASAANAILDGIQSIYGMGEKDELFSSAMLSDGNTYGVASGLIFSFPCRAKRPKDIEIVSGLKWDTFIEEKIKLTEQELLEERELVAHLLK